MQIVLSSDSIVHVVEALGIAGLGYIGYKIKAAVSDVLLEQAKVKEELVGKQNEMLVSVNEKHAENTKVIAVHAASDEAKFDSISRTLVRIDGKLDRLNGKP
jgi:hypothetical protein